MRAIDLVLLAPPAWVAVSMLRRPAVEPLADVGELPVLQLEVASPSRPLRSVTLHRSTSFGTSPTAGIHLRDAGVDRVHGTIDLTAEGWVLADAGSSTGIWANEQPVFSPVVLRPDDEVRIGATVLQVRQARGTA